MPTRKPRLILASASPRRAQLLASARIPFSVCPPGIRETARAGEAPRAYARRMALAKAVEVHARFPQAFVLAADTIVTLGGRILGKPGNRRQAARMLRALSGRHHRVITAVCLIPPQPPRPAQRTKQKTKNAEPRTRAMDLRSSTTTVFFRRLRAEEITACVASGEPLDKAGAYAIQGWASRWTTRIAGCYFNVVGLPVPLVAEMLRRRGFF